MATHPRKERRVWAVCTACACSVPLRVQGRCANLEKSYFRLTSAPDPAVVRPEPVLAEALARLVGLVASGEVNYFYALDQFKVRRSQI